MGIGIVIGAFLSAILNQYYSPFHIFYFSAFVAVTISICGFFLSDEFENNQYALMLNIED